MGLFLRIHQAPRGPVGTGGGEELLDIYEAVDLLVPDAGSLNL